MTIEEMLVRKKELGLSYEQLAALSGVPVGTLQKIFGGYTKAPRYATLSALERALTVSPGEMREASMGQYTDRALHRLMRENASEYSANVQGRYTVEDYYRIREKRRIELIDGVIYDMASPSFIHQILVSQIWEKFYSYIQSKKGRCVPIVSPISVQLDCDDRTMVEPDVIVVCRHEQLQNIVYGQPDLIVEILSPSSRKRDNHIKLHKYAAAGVREYWIVDPDKRSILVYYFEEAEWPVIYGFEDKIPVHIFPEACEIDFAEISGYMRFLEEAKE